MDEVRMRVLDCEVELKHTCMLVAVDVIIMGMSRVLHYYSVLDIFGVFFIFVLG